MLVHTRSYQYATKLSHSNFHWTCDVSKHRLWYGTMGSSDLIHIAAAARLQQNPNPYPVKTVRNFRSKTWTCKIPQISHHNIYFRL
jgi:hypothetical protein